MSREIDNRWHIDSLKKEQWLPTIKMFIDTNHDGLEVNPKLDLTETGLAPYHVKDILEELGFDKNVEIDTNGWELDFWFNYPLRDNENFQVSLSGTGMTFELYIEKDYPSEEYLQKLRNKKNEENQELKKYLDDVVSFVQELEKVCD